MSAPVEFSAADVEAHSPPDAQLYRTSPPGGFV